MNKKKRLFTILFGTVIGELSIKIDLWNQEPKSTPDSRIKTEALVFGSFTPCFLFTFISNITLFVFFQPTIKISSFAFVICIINIRCFLLMQRSAPTTLGLQQQTSKAWKLYIRSSKMDVLSLYINNTL